MSFRKEKKFRLSIHEVNQMKANLQFAGLEWLYAPRVINSCYFDSRNLSMFEDSEEGVLPRKKVRIRWYNDRNAFAKETKISSLEGRFKYTDDACPAKFQEDVYSMQYFDDQYGTLLPSLLVSYEREYFSLESMRVTFDKNIRYQLINQKGFGIHYDPECVMEIKIPADCGDDYVESIIRHPTSRFSKYSRGHLMFLGQLSSY
jgi:hypothetical protein